MKKLKSKIKPKPKVKPKAKKAESGEIINQEQEVIYQGVCPAVRALYVQSGYDKDFHPKNFLDQLRNGHTPSEIAASWGISLGQLNEWFELYAELAQARTVGATAFEAFYKKALRLSAFKQLNVREDSLFKILQTQVGVGSETNHEFSDQSGAELIFIDPKDSKV